MLVKSIPISATLNGNQTRNCSFNSNSFMNNGTTPALQSILSQKRQNSLASSPEMSLTSSESTLSLFSYISASSTDELLNSFHNTTPHPLNTKGSLLDFELGSSDAVSYDYDSSFFLGDDSLDDCEFLEEIDDNFFDKREVSPICPIDPTKIQMRKKPSIMSNLSLSFKRLSVSTSNLLYSADEKVFSNEPRLTDDKLPTSTHIDQELTTFKITTSFPSNNNRTNSNIAYKSRESRINPEFLKLYAFETSARSKGLLRNVDNVANTTDISKIRDRKLALSLKVREKLWNNVVLPPREDMLPTSMSYPEYVNEYTTEDSTYVSLCANNDQEHLTVDGLKLKPWLQLRDYLEPSSRTIKPKGYLNDQTQFTVKGWSNKKWIPISC